MTAIATVLTTADLITPQRGTYPAQSDIVYVSDTLLAQIQARWRYWTTDDEDGDGVSPDIAAANIEREYSLYQVASDG